MSLGLDDCRNHLRAPSSLDLSSEIDLMASCQAKRERFSLGFRGGGVILVPEWPGDGAGQASFGKYETRLVTKGCGLSQLSDDPVHAGVVCLHQVNHFGHRSIA